MSVDVGNDRKHGTFDTDASDTLEGPQADQISSLKTHSCAFNFQEGEDDPKEFFLQIHVSTDQPYHGVHVPSQVQTQWGLPCEQAPQKPSRGLHPFL